MKNKEEEEKKQEEKEEEHNNFCGRSAVLRPSVHILPGIVWCGAGLPPFPAACWWLAHPAVIKVSLLPPDGTVLEDVVDQLFCFFAIKQQQIQQNNYSKVNEIGRCNLRHNLFTVPQTVSSICAHVTKA